tara:strand:- start:2007 stop:2681 length:675 start_codon:yes stop_codon:yes gene_type:complete
MAKKKPKVKPFFSASDDDDFEGIGQSDMSVLSEEELKQIQQAQDAKADFMESLEGLDGLELPDAKTQDGVDQFLESLRESSPAIGGALTPAGTKVLSPDTLKKLDIIYAHFIGDIFTAAQDPLDFLQKRKDALKQAATDGVLSPEEYSDITGNMEVEERNLIGNQSDDFDFYEDIPDFDKLSPSEMIYEKKEATKLALERGDLNQEEYDMVMDDLNREEADLEE